MIKPILAVDTSQSSCSVSVYFSNEKFFESNFNLKHAHAEVLFKNIEYVLSSAKMDPDDLEYIAISSGPGSFTGLRIGMAAIKGIAYASDLSIIPVPTFEALAFQISNFLPLNTDFIIMNKVNMEEIYFAKFRTSPSNYETLEYLKIVKYEDIKPLKQNILIFGNALLDSNNELLNIKKTVFSPFSRFVAEWSRIYGQNLITKEFDYLEPLYFKNFIVKGKHHV
jgi:tRNA threonylcarbamoyladenosine biosynthesis protein TsaB